MSDYGIKVAKPNYDARTAGDADLLFSSSWPSLPVAFETTTTGNTTVDHGLDFPPLTLAWLVSGGVSQKGSAAQPWPDVDSTKVYLNTDLDYIDAPVIHVKCYNIDLSRDVDYPVLKTPTASTGLYDADFGIKIAKQGEDIDSDDLRDYVLHSRCQSPLILAVKTESTATVANTVAYTSPLGYTSWIFSYVKSASGLYQCSPYEAQGYPQLQINATTNTYTQVWGFGDVGATIVALRDPMFASTDSVVTY